MIPSLYYMLVIFVIGIITSVLTAHRPLHTPNGSSGLNPGSNPYSNSNPNPYCCSAWPVCPWAWCMVYTEQNYVLKIHGMYQFIKEMQECWDISLDTADNSEHWAPEGRDDGISSTCIDSFRPSTIPVYFVNIENYVDLFDRGTKNKVYASRTVSVQYLWLLSTVLASVPVSRQTLWTRMSSYIMAVCPVHQ